MLKVIYSNDMVQLAAQLADIQQSAPLPPLQAETIIVQSNELSRWLSLLLASQHGISANLEFPYPSAYIWRLFRKMLPDVPPESAYSKDVLAWRIFALLPECRGLDGFEAVNHYLGSQTDELKQFTLAYHLADSFDQYLMYRPDWIRQWEQGNTSHWQSQLWQKLTEQDDLPKHRANLLLQMHDLLVNSDQKPAALAERISIIGITAMPPVYLKLFELMSRFCDVTLYFLSPSQGYWGDLLDSKSQAKQMSLLEPDDEVSSHGHPLLASLGKQGQEFFEQLQDCQHEAIDRFVPPEAESLLAQLQFDIFNLRDIDIAQNKTLIAADDHSIQVHSCHSPMREIEVLHDQLLALFEADAELSPTDIVVMTPDIEQYAPMIDAVFAGQASHQSIPYSIADCGVRYQSQLISAFMQLLDLPQSRFEVDSILELLQNQSIQQRFALDEAAIGIIRQWLKKTHIRWGLNAADKARFDLPQNAANTWRAGLDRLLLAYAMPQANQPGKLFENKLAFDVISGERAGIMAKLCAFVDALDKARQQLSVAKSATNWQQSLNQIVDAFFTVKTGQSQERELIHIRDAAQHLVDSIEAAQCEQKIPLTLVKDWLNRHLDNQTTQSRFMGHGVTFCGMVPMRSIPFKVLCLIGMNDESYPRRQPKLGFDLLAKDFRRGDRSRRDDDRYLFLEALLSARSCLYISYVGASIHDNAKIPPSVLVSDLRDVLNLSYQCEGHNTIWENLLTEHPLQAFSHRYFDGSAEKLFSYQQANCPTLRQQSKRWFAERLPEPDDSWRQISLPQLIQFFRHPARYLVTERLGIRLELTDDQLETNEPFQLDGLQAWQLRQQLLTARLTETNTADIQNYIEAMGVLPQGYLGEQIFAQQSNVVEQFVDTLLPVYPDTFLEPLNIELQLAEFHINGQLQQLSSKGLFFYRMAKTKGADILIAWLQHLILNCIKPDRVLLHTELLTEDGHYQFKPVLDAQTHLQQLLNYYWQGLQTPLPLFNNTSFAFAKASLNDSSRANPDNAMWAAWLGGQYQTGEAEDMYHQQLYASAPLDETFQQLALAIYEPIKAHLQAETL